MSGVANAAANAAPIAQASATALLQQTAHLHIQSNLSDAYQGEVESEKSYLPGVLGLIPIDGAEQSFSDLIKPEPAKFEAAP